MVRILAFLAFLALSPSDRNCALGSRMRTVRFKQVDVFTARPFAGNPVAVILDAQGLADAEMARIAAWTNLSETTFVLPSARASYRLRIFTPRAELTFAGHPTIGSAHAVREAGLVPADGPLVQECAAGLIPLAAGADGAIAARVPPARLAPFPHAAVAARSPSAAALVVRLETGRTRQIRRHFAGAGFPVVGETLSGARTAQRLLLHAFELEVPWPAASGGTIRASAPPPDDFLSAATALGLPADVLTPGESSPR